MSYISIDNVGGVGAFLDRQPDIVVPEAWTSVQNMRMKNREAARFPGHQAVMSDGLLAAPGFIVNIPGQGGSYWIYTSKTKAYVIDAGAHSEITRSSGGDYAAAEYRDWGACVVGGVPIINNIADVPQYWPVISSGTDLANLTAWPSGLRARVIRAFGSFLVALNTLDGSGTYPHRVRWSSQADPGTVPASWDVTDPTVDTGQFDLTDVKGGVILDGLMLGSQFVIYKQSSTHIMRFTGGTQVMAVDFLFDAGILATRCVCLIDAGRRHFVVTEDDIIIHSGTKDYQSVVEDKVKDAIFAELDETNKANSFVFDNRRNKEVWFCYPTTGAEFPNKAFVYNYFNQTIAFRDFQGLSADIGAVTGEEATAWDDLTGDWDSADGTWARQGARNIVVADPSASKLWQIDTGLTYGTLTVSSLLQRTGLALVGKDRQGSPVAQYANRLLAKRIWPKIRGTAQVSVRLGAQETLDGDVIWAPAQFFDPEQKYLDFTVSGRLLAVEFSSVDDADWLIEGYGIEVDQLGVL